MPDDLKTKSGELSERLSGLRQELYDNILDLVFTATPGPRHIDEHYRPPALLQVSRATRQQFAKSYYHEGTVFILPMLPDDPSLVPAKEGLLVFNWITSLGSSRLIEKLAHPARVPYRRNTEAFLTNTRYRSGRRNAVLVKMILKNIYGRQEEIMLEGSHQIKHPGLGIVLVEQD